MSLRILILLVIVVVFSGCSTKKKQAELLEQTKPEWLKERPVNSAYYFGIGITTKIGSPMLYEDRAKDRALADISSQISSTIKSESMLYQVEDKNGIRDYLQNRIKSTTTEYLEGYEYVDKWEDLSNVYVFYQLSKQKYREIIAKRKAEAIQSAKEKYLAGLKFLQQKSHVNSIEHFALCIDVLSGYLNETTTTLMDGKMIDLVSASKGELTDIIRNMHMIKCDSMDVNRIDKPCVIVYSGDDSNVGNMPIRYRYSGGYLANDLVKTNDRGVAYFPELPKGKNGGDQKLTAEIDLLNLARQVTKNLYVRKIIEQQKAAQIVVDIK